MRSPGVWLRAVALQICDEDTTKRIIDPLVADMQWEDAESAAKGDRWRRWGIRVLASVAFWRVLAGHAIYGGSSPPMLRSASPTRVAGFILAVTVLMTALLIVPPVLQFSEMLHVSTPLERILAVVYLVPQAAVLALSAGPLMGGVVALAGRSPTRPACILTAVMACVFSVIVLVMAERLLPSANQAFRELAYSRVSPLGLRVDPLRRGVPELSWSELRARIENSEDHPLSSQSRRVRAEYHLRGAVSAMPIACALPAVSLSALTRRRIVAAAVGVLAILGVYFILYSARAAALDGLLSPVIAAWLPNLIAVCVAGALWVHHARARRTATP